MNDTNDIMYDQGENDSTNDSSSTPPDPMTLFVQLQQQQLLMQQQMTQMMAHLMQPPAGNSGSAGRRSRIDRPVLTADCSDNKWIVFTDAWCRYKEMSGLVDPDAIRHELRATCDPAVNEMLFNFVGPDVLNVASEEQLLAHIKSVAVKTVHREVYRQQFFSMRQSENESITRFISRLNSQAMLCDFAKQCDCGANTCTTSYSEDVIMSQTITGLYSSSHQTKILSDMNNIKTLRDLTARLLTLESTSHATDHFNPDIPNTGGITAPIRSDYKRSKDSSPHSTHCSPNSMH